MKDLKAMLMALKSSAKKDQNQFIDEILKMIDGKAKVAPNKTLARLLRIQENKPMILTVLDLLCRFAISLAKHEIIFEILKLLKGLL